MLYSVRPVRPINPAICPPRYNRGPDRVSAGAEWVILDGFVGSEKTVEAATDLLDGPGRQIVRSFTVVAEKSLTLQIAQLTISYRHFLPFL